MAIGLFWCPKVHPRVFGGAMMQSHEYRRPEPLPARRVLVVGPVVIGGKLVTWSSFLVRGLLGNEDLRVRAVAERKDKFQVDHDWVLPDLMRLMPDGGHLDQYVRRHENTYFDTPACQVFYARTPRQVWLILTGRSHRRPAFSCALWQRS